MLGLIMVGFIIVEYINSYHVVYRISLKEFTKPYCYGVDLRVHEKVIITFTNIFPHTTHMAIPLCHQHTKHTIYICYKKTRKALYIIHDIIKKHAKHCMLSMIA